MRHLDQTRNRRSSQNIFVYIIIFILIIYFTFTFGLKLVINSTIFISNLFSSKNNDTNNQEQEVYGHLSVDNIPNATNSAEFEISGSVLNFDLLTFYINDQKTDEINVDSKDSYTTTIGDLDEGDNTLFLIAKTKDNKYRKKSDTFTIIYKKTKPLLEISEPTDKAKVNNSSITIKGKTDKETYIKINDMPVVVNANGSFEYSVNLKDGDNEFKIIATDIASNTEEKTITVNYNKDN